MRADLDAADVQLADDLVHLAQVAAGGCRQREDAVPPAVRVQQLDRLRKGVRLRGAVGCRRDEMRDGANE